VNTVAAQTYGDFTFASPGNTLVNGSNTFTITAQYLHTNATTTLTVNLPTNVVFQYDANGNMTGDGARVFAYDAENQLINVYATNLWQVGFLYDGLNRRRIERDYIWTNSAWLKTNETHFLYDGMQVVQERDANNNPVVTYTRGLDLSMSLSGAGGIGGLLARTDANGSTFYHSDGNGNITALIDGNQDMAARYEYDGFGRLINKQGSMADANRYRFSSQEFFANPNIYGYKSRFYDPTPGRWLNRDPIGELDGVNLYRFVGNNPVSRVDPYGLSWQGNIMIGSWTAAGTIIGGLGGFIGGGGAGLFAGLGVGDVVTVPAGAIYGAGIGGTAGGVAGRQLGTYFANSLGLNSDQSGNQKSGGGHGGSNDGGKGVKFPGGSRMAKALNCTEEQFHREIKRDILKDMFKDFPEQLKAFGDNPDVGYDSSGNIWLKSVQNGKTFNTGVPLDLYSY
jgi:RHS repeat-associated protein